MTGTWGVDLSFIASGDLSAYKYHFVKMEAAAGESDQRKVALAGADEKTVGILQNAPSAEGEEAKVRVLGTSELVIQGTGYDGGDLLTPDANGHGVQVDLADENVGAMLISVREGYSAGERGDVLIMHMIANAAD